MKRARIAAIAAAVCCLFTLPLSAEADVYTDSFREELESFSDVLPEELRGEWSELLYSGVHADEAGGQFSYAGMLEKVTEAFGGAWRSCAVLLARAVSFLLVAAMFLSFKNSMNSTALVPAFSLCSSLCLSILLTDTVYTILSSSTAYINALSSLAGGIAPLACAVLAASGKITAAASGNAALMLLYALFQNIESVLLLPLTKLSLCFGMISSAVPDTRLGTIAASIRRFFTWLTALIALLVTFVIGAQQIIAQSADSLTLRTVKFTLGNFIPLVGSALSDALGTAVGSLTLIKNVCGTFGAAAAVLLMLPVAAQLLLARAALGIARFCAELLSCEQEGRLIGEFNGTLGCILAVTAFSSFLFLFVLGTVISLNFGGA